MDKQKKSILRKLKLGMALAAVLAAESSSLRLWGRAVRLSWIIPFMMP